MRLVEPAITASAFPVVGALANDVARACLRLQVGLPNVLANNAECQQYCPAEEAYDAYGACPARDGMAKYCLDNCPEYASKAYERHNHAEARNHPYRLDGEARDPVEGEPQHLGEGVVRLSCDSLVPLVVDRRAGKAYERDHAAKGEVDLAELSEFLEYARGDEAVVGVVEHRLDAHPVEQLVKALCGEALEERIGVALAARAIHDRVSCLVLLHHVVDGVYIVLAVAVYGDGYVAKVLGLHEAREHGVLVATIAGLGDADVVGVLVGKVVDELPRAVA